MTITVLCSKSRVFEFEDSGWLGKAFVVSFRRRLPSGQHRTWTIRFDAVSEGVFRQITGRGRPDFTVPPTRWREAPKA